MSNNTKKNFKKLNKVVAKGIKKMIKTTTSRPIDEETRITVYTSKNAMVITTGIGTDIPFGNPELNKTAFNILRGSVHGKGKVSGHYFDGHDGTEIFMGPTFKPATQKPSGTDYARMQGIDLDDMADREPQRDNYIDKSSGRKATVIDRDRSFNPLVLAELKDTISIKDDELKKLKQNIDDLKAKIDTLENENADLKRVNGNLHALVDKHITKTRPSDAVTTSSKITELENRINKMGVKESQEDQNAEVIDKYYLRRFQLERTEDSSEESDTFMFTKLEEFRNKKESYGMCDLYQIIETMYDGGVDKHIYKDLGQMTSNPASKNCRIYNREAYSLMIALAVPASYVGKFIDTLVKDFREGIFIPTIQKRIPNDFDEMLLGLYSDVARIQTRLYTNLEELPALYSVKVISAREVNRRMVYTIGDGPVSVKDLEGEFVIIPRGQNAYEFIQGTNVTVFRSNSPLKMIKMNANNGFTDIKSGSDENYTIKDEIERFVSDDLLPDNILASENMVTKLDIFKVVPVLSYTKHNETN